MQNHEGQPAACPNKTMLAAALLHPIHQLATFNNDHSTATIRKGHHTAIPAVQSTDRNAHTHRRLVRCHIHHTPLRQQGELEEVADEQGGATHALPCDFISQLCCLSGAVDCITETMSVRCESGQADWLQPVLLVRHPCLHECTWELSELINS